MKKIFTYKVLVVAIISFLLLQSKVSMAQWTADIVGSVKKEEDKKRMAGATITVKRDGVVWKTITADARGKFEIPLLPEAVYIIEVSKPMHVTKRIEVSTKNVPAEDSKFGFEIPFEVSLFEKKEGLDVSILDKPIAKIAFEPDFGTLEFDPAYTKSIKAQLDRLKKELAARLKAEAENKRLNQKSYDVAILAADKAFNTGKYEVAKPLYEKAAKIFPKETYPEFQLGDISDKLREQGEANKRYKSAVTRADAAFKARNWSKATSEYETAAGLKATEQYPKDKIKEVKGIIDNEKKAEKEYAEAISSADQLLTAKDFEKAKTAYKKAAGLKSYEQYPKDKLTEIEGILAEIIKKEAAEKAKEAKYQGLIVSADNLLGSKDYAGAKVKYTAALGVKPTEQYPKDKLTEIEGILAEIIKKEAAEKVKEAKYQGLIASADNLLGSKDYAGAKVKYTAALGVKSTEQYPKDKLTEIEGILAEIIKKEAAEKVKEAKEAKYQGLIASADNLLGSKDYAGAKVKYTAALGVKSTEQYPKDKLKEIEVLLAKIAREKAEAEAAKMAAGERNAKYDETIVLANTAFDSGNYEVAKSKLNEALGIKPNEQYPKDKLTEIEGILAEIAKNKSAADAANLAASQKEEKYNQAINLADKAFTAKSFDTAKGKYNEAITIKPSEQYPKDRLVAIEVALAEISKKSAADAANLAASQKEEKYNQAINLADKSFTAKSFDTAKKKYNEAIAIKPSEQYPKDKLAEIESILAKRSTEEALAAESKRKKKEYFEALIAEADGEFQKENYEGAKSKYNQALGVFPEDQYPKDKLKDIVNILAGLKANSRNAALAKKQIEEDYKKLIAQGDNSFSGKNYKGAKLKYQKALSLKSSELYPRDQLVEIERILNELAAKESAITLKNNAQKQKEEAYASLIQKGDNQFSSKQFRSALSNYKQAIEIKPSEIYPKEKIKEINKLLADLAVKEKSNSANAEAEKQKRAEYNKRIYNADRIFRLKDYEKAKNKYNEALDLFPSEQYPKEKIADIEALLNPKPKEDIIVNNTNNRDRAKINDDNEREIERRMALMMGKSTVKNEKRLEKDKLDYNHQETIRITAGVERTVIANNEFEKYTIQEQEFLKRQDELNIDKTKAHYIYVDDLEEGDLLLKEQSEELRASNRKEVEQIASDLEKSKRRSRKMRKQKEVNVLELKSNVAKQEEARLRASIGRTNQNDSEIKRVAEDMNNMKLDRIDSYKDNVIKIAIFKEELNATETKRLNSAEEDRQVNKKERDRVYDESRNNLKKQNKRYYKNAKKVDDFRNKVNKQDAVDQKGADQRREVYNSELTKEKNKLGETTIAQKKRYEAFHLKLKEAQELNNNFLADLKLLERDKILLANTSLNDVYRGENKSSENEALANKYSQGITEETLESGSSIVIKRTKVTGSHVDVYERVFYKWGGSYFLKNGKNITQSLWDKESID